MRRQLDASGVAAEHGDAADVTLLASNGEFEAIDPRQAFLAAGIGAQGEFLQRHIAVEQFDIELAAVLFHRQQGALADTVAVPQPGHGTGEQHDQKHIEQIDHRNSRFKSQSLPYLPHNSQARALQRGRELISVRSTSQKEFAMHCPACRTTRLQPTKLDGGLLAHGCAACSGALVSLLYYRDWAERSPQEPQASEVAVSEAGDSQQALTCPKCSKLMGKYQISGTRANRLDLCGSCDEAWLDGGEWELLKALELSQRMPAIFTEAWQRRVRQQASEEARRQRFTRLVGEEAINRADEVRAWLNDHPQRRELLFYIGHD